MDGVVGPRLLHAGAEGEVVGQGHCQLIPLRSNLLIPDIQTVCWS